jgi:hypothetical protein
MIITQSILVKKDNIFSLLEEIKMQNEIFKKDLILPFIKKLEKKELERNESFNIKKLELLSLENNEDSSNKLKKIEESFDTDKKDFEDKMRFLNSLENQIIYIIYHEIMSTKYTSNQVLLKLFGETYKIPIFFK